MLYRVEKKNLSCSCNFNEFPGWIQRLPILIVILKNFKTSNEVNDLFSGKTLPSYFREGVSNKDYTSDEFHQWVRQVCASQDSLFIADCPLDFSDELDFKPTINVFMWNDDTEHEAWGWKASSYFREPHEGTESGYW